MESTTKMRMMKQTPGVERRVTGVPARARINGVVPSLTQQDLNDFQTGFTFPFKLLGGAVSPIAAPAGTFLKAFL